MPSLVPLLAMPLHITCSNENILSFFDEFLLNLWLLYANGGKD